MADIVQKRAKLAGLEGDFGGHSLRSGFFTEGARQGVALPALMAMTDNRSVVSVVGTFKPVELRTTLRQGSREIETRKTFQFPMQRPSLTS